MFARLFSSLVAALLTFAQAASLTQVPKLSRPAKSPTIVIGFVGGYISGDNQIHSGVQIAERLRKDYSSGVYVKVFENHRGEDAHREILKALDTDSDGTLSLEDKKNARIIIYGHSWGASETVTLARKLQDDGIPVALTIQVDSVAKPGERDDSIPPNVAQAANFYQTDGWLHGRVKIYAENPSQTQIIENLRLDYASNPVQCNGYPWYARAFERPHIEIECDPNVTSRVESLIRSKLAVVESASADR
jgi:hypothetical protein